MSNVHICHTGIPPTYYSILAPSKYYRATIEYVINYIL